MEYGSHSKTQKVLFDVKDIRENVAPAPEKWDGDDFKRYTGTETEHGE